MLAKRSSNWNATPSKKAKQTFAKRSKRTYGIPTAVYCGRQPFPKQFFNTVRYCEGMSSSVSVGVQAGRNQISTNSCFDPNSSGVGHQPLYFDQLCSIYDHYTVLRSRTKITVMLEPSVTSPVVVVLYIDDDTSTIPSVTINAERTGAKTYVISPSAGTMASPSIYMNWDAKKAFGPGTQADSTMQGNASASPTEQQYYTIECGSQITGQSFTVQYWTETEYDCVWDEFVTIAQS